MNEHGFECSTQNDYHEKLILVPAIQQNNIQSGELFRKRYSSIAII